MSPELPTSRLSTMDAAGHRLKLYPAAARGKYASRKRLVHGVLLALFLVLPWLRPNGRQLLLLDVARREFFFFGVHFRAHDAPLLLFLLLGFTFSIGLVTAIWGRLWCGWACPQTVFTEALFRKIESWTEGNHLERRARDAGPLSPEKVMRKAAKWALFALVSLVITHSFLAYFVGSRELVGMVSGSPLRNWTSFLVILFTTGVILFDFGWFREQFCVIMCPYGRFQSVLLGTNSMVVGYDTARGEPRRGYVPADKTQGDCVNCFKCVNVCPTGIDIRRGLQMECIACTACIDACDEVMAKTGRPLGLIRYTTLAELSGKKRYLFTPRVAVYALLAATCAAALAYSLRTKDFLEVEVLRATGTPYETVPSERGPQVVNHFRLELSNQTDGAQKLELVLDDATRAAGVELVMPMNPVPLADGAETRADFFLRFPSSALEHGSKKVGLHWRGAGVERPLEVTLVGPGG